MPQLNPAACALHAICVELCKSAIYTNCDFAIK